jgi:murein DD-endopeptidase MepM/ murein hydrolase activator NlpD
MRAPCGGAAIAVLALLMSGATVVRTGRAATVRPPSVRPGDLFELRLPQTDVAPESALFLGKTYPAIALPGEPGAMFLLGTDLEARPGDHEIVVRRAGGTEERFPLTIEPRAFAEERLSLPPAMVTPPKELEERIAREQELAAEVYRSSAAGRLWERGFSRPLAQEAAGNFGRRRILNGLARSPHAGQDYRAPAGTPVKAVAAGKVRIARDFYYSGLTLIVDHGAGLVSQYLHLEKMLVAEGEQVSAGQVIGRVGSTGRATGPHLHLGLRLFEQRVDPETLWGLFPAREP